MKKLLLLAVLISAFPGWSQMPYMGTPTVIPQFPTSSDIVKIITKVTTPNQGIVVDQASFSVTQSPKEINIRACYWNGMLPATQDFVDTLTLGQLAAGSYTLKHKAYMSSGQQVCHPTDSNVVSLNLVVATTTGLQEIKKKPVLIFPNPASDKVFLQNSGFLKATMYSADGRVVKTLELPQKTEIEIEIEDLAPGLYFICVSGNETKETIKFIKN
ncbi:hypothetical protein CNR22_05460 [Sphingobacteriaceae bacterium]|nr:hypothetical protein CNR22_05460 [Sphingobacteriaceae bacterium]